MKVYLVYEVLCGELYPCAIFDSREKADRWAKEESEKVEMLFGKVPHRRDILAGENIEEWEVE